MDTPLDELHFENDSLTKYVHYFTLAENVYFNSFTKTSTGVFFEQYKLVSNLSPILNRENNFTLNELGRGVEKELFELSTTDLVLSYLNKTEDPSNFIIQHN